MPNDYDPKKIEPKWQEIWEKTKPFEAKENSDKPKYYALMEFPYPSGEGLHTGHVRGYTAMDIISRKRRREGFNVMYPIGWDAFGLPAENYAIKTGIQPAITTQKNIENYRKQFKSLGILLDWSREIDTTDPKYYKWTQWLFLQFFKHGLAYKAMSHVNWCPKDKTVLANEEVIDGKCERCGTPVEKRDKEQWMLAITKYAERLDTDLDTVDYPERVKAQQRNWIGKSEGAEINFELDFKKDPKANDNRGPNGEKAAIKIFTTRPDTIFGATYLVLAPEHPWVKLATDNDHDVLENKDEVKAYIESVKNKEDIERTAEGKEKTGVELKGVKAINPASKEEIPMWVADYVLPHYGTGAIMAVPAHDERDNEFAKKFNLPIKIVIEPTYVQTSQGDGFRENEPVDHREAIIAIVKHWSEDKYIALKWKKVAWGTFITGGIEKGQTPEEAARMELREEIGYVNAKFVKDFGVVHGKFYHVPKQINRNAHAHVVYLELLNDEKVEIADAEKAIHDVLWLTTVELQKFLTPETHHHALRWFLGDEEPYTSEGTLTNSGEFDRLESAEAKDAIIKFVGGEKKTTFKLRDWVFSRQRYWGEPIPMIHCDACGWQPVPEKDLPLTLPEVERYEPTDTGESPLANIPEWVNTTCPKCGGNAKRETDTMPQWAGSSWYYLRYTDPHNDEEFASMERLKEWMPVDWYNGGMEHTTLHLLYSRFWNKFLFDIGLVPASEPYKKRTSHGLILAEGGEKMSKSKGNVVNPDKIIEQFGADTLRLYEMFMGPFEQAIAWSEASLVGPRRFIERVWRLSQKISDNAEASPEVETLKHQTIKKVGDDIESMGFNTSISSLMIYASALEKREAISKEEYETLVLLLAPFAPFVTEEMWQELGHSESIHTAPWPVFDPSKLVSSEKVIAVQVNGKVRATITTAPDDTEEGVKTRVLALPEVQKWLNGQEPKRVVVLLGKVVNVVL